MKQIIKTGDIVDIEVVWKEFGGRLRKFIEARVSDTHIAEELTQELLIKSYQNIDKLKENDRIEAWLFRVARNVVNDYYRKKASEIEYLFAEMDSFVTSIEEPSPTNHIREDLNRCIKPFIDQLPAKYRQTLTAVDLEGSTQKALADRLGVSHATVKSQTQRGRAQLHKLFRRCCDFDIDARGNVVDYKPKTSEYDCECAKDNAL